MLYHIRPRFFGAFRAGVRLLEVEFRELGVALSERHLAVGRPYPNKAYRVGYRRGGKRHIDGILIEADRRDAFHYRAAWSIDGCRIEHRVTYEIADREFDFVSDDMTMWLGTMDGWRHRGTPWSPERNDAPVNVEPVMELFEPHWKNAIDSKSGGDGFVLLREQVFSMPTIERERLTRPPMNDRLPRLEDVFVGKQPRCRQARGAVCG
jgi:hypothetical protein